ncbi:MAG: DUF885 domain-containing protein, partial [Pseudomonadota bacterium]|nr:DUF885 domain-containing protein [Pseudomonadota bacterium]
QLPAATRATLRAEAQDSQRRLVAAVQEFHDWLQTSWLPAARASTAAVDLPRGADYYAAMLEQGSSTTLSPQQIHRIGLGEVARIDAEMAKVRSDSGFRGSSVEFRDWLRSDPRFRFADADAELTAFQALAKRVDPLLPQLFAELPRLPYGVRPMPAAEGSNAPHYVRGAVDGSRSGWFEANLNNLAAWPSWTMDALFLHEAMPGHHLQIARAQELEQLPMLRRTFSNTAYVEGWGLYAEGLGSSLGLYADPYARYGRLALEAHRACRLVLDTGLHALGWTRDQAIDYLMAHASLERAFAEAEIDRYLVWPGQATGYKMGELRILANRDKARLALGERFDLRHFHNAVLDHGVLPLSVLDQVIDDWIADQRRAH